MMIANGENNDILQTKQKTLSLIVNMAKTYIYIRCRKHYLQIFQGTHTLYWVVNSAHQRWSEPLKININIL